MSGSRPEYRARQGPASKGAACTGKFNPCCNAADGALQSMLLAARAITAQGSSACDNCGLVACTDTAAIRSLIMGAARCGATCRISAITPDTCAAAIELPDM